MSDLLSDEDQGNLNSRSIIRWSAELPPTLGRSGTRAAHAIVVQYRDDLAFDANPFPAARCGSTAPRDRAANG